MKSKVHITIALSIIEMVVHWGGNYFLYFTILDIALLYGIAYIFPFFEFRENAPMKTPVFVFFLFDTSVIGASITKLDFLFKKNDVWEWIIKGLVLVIYMLILNLNYRKWKSQISKKMLLTL